MKQNPAKVYLMRYRQLQFKCAALERAIRQAMDNATKNGQEIIDDLKIKYNKSRQAGITAELSDIVSGFEAVN